MQDDRGSLRRWLVSMVVVLTYVGGGEAIGLEPRLREQLVLPTSGGFYELSSLSVIEGTEVVLASAIGRAEKGERPGSLVWKIDRGAVKQILADHTADWLQGCVPGGRSAALCVFLSEKGSLRAGILRLDDDSLRGLDDVGSIVAETVQGIAPKPGGGALVWGMAGLRPFAATLDAEGKLLWSFRWEQFGLGEFYDGVVAGESARLLARSRSERGTPEGAVSELELTAGGQMAGSRTVASPGDQALPLLDPSSPEHASGAGPSPDDAEGAAPGLVVLDDGLGLATGLLDWTRLDSQTIVHLALDGTTTMVVVHRGDGEGARAPVAGLPFSGLVAGSGRRIYVLTTDFERTPPPKQVLRLSGFELDG